MGDYYKCPRCGNSDIKKLGYLNGKIYCRACLTFNGQEVKQEKNIVNKKCDYSLTYELSESQKNISKIHITNSYSARWDDVDTSSLVGQLEAEKTSMYDTYEQVSYEIHQFGNNITAEQYLTMTEKNLNTLGQDTQYQQMIHDHKLSMDDYVNWLTNQNYQCQKINS